MLQIAGKTTERPEIPMVDVTGLVCDFAKDLVNQGVVGVWSDIAWAMVRNRSLKASATMFGVAVATAHFQQTKHPGFKRMVKRARELSKELREACAMKKVVAINDRGLRLGEDHQNATLTNCEVEMIRELHREGLSYKTLATKFDVSKSTIAMICRYERRGDTATTWKTVHVADTAKG